MSDSRGASCSNLRRRLTRHRFSDGRRYRRRQGVATNEGVRAGVATSPPSVEAVVRRLRYRRHRERIEEIGRAIALAEPEQQRRLLGEKQELVRELRAAGESGAFMPAAEARRRQTTATQ